MKTKKTVKLGLGSLALVLALTAGTSVYASDAGWLLGGAALGLGGAYLLNNANYGYNRYPTYYGYGYYPTYRYGYDYYGPRSYGGYYGNTYYVPTYSSDYYGYGYSYPSYSSVYWY